MIGKYPESAHQRKPVNESRRGRFFTAEDTIAFPFGIREICEPACFDLSRYIKNENGGSAPAALFIKKCEKNIVF